MSIFRPSSHIQTGVGILPFLLPFLLATCLHAADPVSRQTFNPLGPNSNVLPLLAAQEARQREAARGWSVFHDFTFEDRVGASGIRFQMHPVEDASKNYKAVHYDHGTGLAVADVDGDGLLDVYFVDQRGGNQLWRNVGGGRFEDITTKAGVALADRVCVTASFADYDNDGRPDLFVTTVRMGNALFHNEGNGVFRDVTAESGLAVKQPRHSSGAVWFDFNNDGLLDLFVCNVGSYTRGEKGKDGSYLGRSDAFLGWMFPDRGEKSVLYQNRGGGKFEDVSASMGLEHVGWSGDATFCDVNGDGFPDLYVLSMSGRDRLYENQGGTRFVDQSDRYFPKTPWGAMGVKFFDFNLDGEMDLLVTDMHSDMTSRQIRAGERDFSAGFEKQKSDPWCSSEWSAIQVQAATNNILGNAFFRNAGQGKFVESSTALGLETYWPWGVSVADLNADGYEDVIVTAGMGYPLRYAINSVLLNEQGRRFVDSEFVLGVEPRAGKRTEKVFFTLDASGDDRRHPIARGKTGLIDVMGTLSSRSSVAFDVDGDGDLDVITNEWNDRPQVLISNLAQRHPVHFLQVKLVGTKSNRDGLGARVRVLAGGHEYTRSCDGKSGYLSQSSMPLYFGLDAVSRAERIEIRWPSGTRQIITDGIPSNGLLTVTEGR